MLDKEIKILAGNKRIMFKDLNNKKEELNYRKVKKVTINKNTDTLAYKYMIIAGREPLLMQVIKEYKGKINLYAIEYQKTYGMTISITDNFAHYYVNKGFGIEVMKLGSSEHLFGKKKFNKTVFEYPFSLIIL